MPAPNIVRWDGHEWHRLGEGIGRPDDFSYVFALAPYAGDLIAGGRFDIAGGNPALSIARWDGHDWSPVGGGIGHEFDYPWVDAVTAYCGDLIAGGSFHEAGGNPAEFIARWDGTEWSPLGSGLNDEVATLGVFAGNLYVGGQFYLAGQRPSWHIGRWTGAPANVPGARAPWAQMASLSLAIPNPYQAGETMTVTAVASGLAEVTVYDITGRQIRLLLSQDIPSGRHTFVWDGRDDTGKRASSGTYVVLGQHQTAACRRRVLLIQ